MMDRYYKFDALAFIKDSPKWDDERARLEKELEAVTELGGIKNSPIRGSGISNPVARTAEKRDEIYKEIKRLDMYRIMLDYAMRHLDDKEKDVLNAFFFFEDGRVKENALRVAETYGINYPKGVYTLRREAVERVSELITERFL